MIINKIRKNTGKRNKFKYFVIITQSYVNVDSVLDSKPLHGVNLSIHTLRSIES